MKWEYTVHALGSFPHGNETYLDLLGDSGWELVSVVVERGIHIAYFKRPKSE